MGSFPDFEIILCFFQFLGNVTEISMPTATSLGLRLSFELKRFQQIAFCELSLEIIHPFFGRNPITSPYTSYPI